MMTSIVLYAFDSTTTAIVSICPRALYATAGGAQMIVTLWRYSGNPPSHGPEVVDMEVSMVVRIIQVRMVLCIRFSSKGSPTINIDGLSPSSWLVEKHQP